jgi:general secretion pathway protein D
MNRLTHNQIMKTPSLKWTRLLGGILAFLSCAALQIHAQPRGGGGGGGGGFGGFGGGGFFNALNNANRNTGTGTGTGQYNNNGSVGSATIAIDPDTHNIVVIADEETSLQISNVIANLDAPQRQVLIKVVFLEVEHNNASEIGVEGGFTHNSFSSFLGTNVIANGANIFGLSGLNTMATNFNALGQSSTFPTPLSSGLSGGAGGLYQIASSDFQATLRAIAQANKVEILSRPSVLARDGQLAKIVSGQEVYLPSGVTYTTAGNATIPIINGNYTAIGIILNVTPYIGANNLIEMILQPQTSALDTSTLGQQIAAGGGTPVFAPNINIRSADTVVVTPDSQTVVIGGLMYNSKSSGSSKIPLLGDIPVLGALFRSQTKSADKRELLIFLTPHIVQAPSQLAALSGSEQNHILTPKSYSEQELDRFLERVPAKKSR